MSDSPSSQPESSTRAELERQRNDLKDISDALRNPEHAELATMLSIELPKTMEAIQKLLDRVGDIAEEEARPVCEKASSLLERAGVLMKEIETRTAGDATKAEMEDLEIKQVLEAILTNAQTEGERKGGFGEVGYRATNKKLHRLRILGVNVDGNVQLEKVDTGRTFPAVPRDNFLGRVEKVYTSDSGVKTQGDAATLEVLAVEGDTEAEKTLLRPTWEDFLTYNGKQLMNGKTLVVIDRIEQNKKNDQCTIHFTPVGGSTAFTEKMKQKNWETSAWKFPEEVVSGASDSDIQRPVTSEPKGADEKFDLSRILKEAVSEAGEEVVSQEDIASANERIDLLRERVRKLKRRFSRLAQNDPLRERIFNAFDAINENAIPFTGNESSERWEDGLLLLSEHEEKLSRIEHDIAKELGTSSEAQVDTTEALPGIEEVNTRLAELKKSVTALYDKTRQGRYSKDIQQRVVRAKQDIMAGMDATPDLSAIGLRQKKKRLENFEVRFQKLKDDVEALSGGEASADNETREEEMTGFASLNYDTLLLQTGGEKPTEVDVSLEQLGVPELVDEKSTKGGAEFVLQYADGIDLRVKYIRNVHEDAKGVFRGWVRAGEGKKRKQLKQEVGVEVGQTGNFEAMFRAFKEKIKKISAPQERSEPEKSEKEDVIQADRPKVTQEKKIDADSREIASFNEQLRSLQERVQFFHEQVQQKKVGLESGFVAKEQALYGDVFSELKQVHGQMSLKEFRDNQGKLEKFDTAYKSLVDQFVELADANEEAERLRQKELDEEMRDTNLRIAQIREQLEGARVDLAKAVAEKYKASGVGQKLRRLFGAKDTSEDQYTDARTQYDELLSQLAVETENQRAVLQRVLTEESRKYKGAISAEMVSIRNEDTVPEKVGKWVQKVWNKMGEINLGSFLEKKGKDGDQDTLLATWAQQTGVIGFAVKSPLKLLGLRPLVSLGLGVSGLWSAKAVMSGTGGAIGTQAGLDSMHRARATRALSVYENADTAEDSIRENLGLVGEDGIEEINKIHKELQSKKTLEAFGRTSAQQSEQLLRILTTFESYAQVSGFDPETDPEYVRVRDLHQQVADRIFEQEQNRQEQERTEVSTEDVQAYMKALGLLGEEDAHRLKRLGTERRKRWGKIITSVATGVVVGKLVSFAHNINEKWSNAHEMSEKPVIHRTETPAISPPPAGVPEHALLPPTAEPVPATPEFRTGVVATDTIPKGGALLNSLERLQASMSAEDIERIRQAHVAMGESKWLRYSPEKVLERWRVEQAGAMGHTFNASGQSYDNVYHAGAKVLLEFDEHGYPRASLGKEHVTELKGTAFRPRVEDHPVVAHTESVPKSTDLTGRSVADQLAKDFGDGKLAGKLVSELPHDVEKALGLGSNTPLDISSIQPVGDNGLVSLTFENGKSVLAFPEIGPNGIIELHAQQELHGDRIVRMPVSVESDGGTHGAGSTHSPKEVSSPVQVTESERGIADPGSSGSTRSAGGGAGESAVRPQATSTSSVGEEGAVRGTGEQESHPQKVLDSAGELPRLSHMSYDQMRDYIDEKDWSKSQKIVAKKYATLLSVRRGLLGEDASGAVDGSNIKHLFKEQVYGGTSSRAEKWLEQRVGGSVDRFNKAAIAFQRGLLKGESFHAVTGNVDAAGMTADFPDKINAREFPMLEEPTTATKDFIKKLELQQLREAFEPVDREIKIDLVGRLSVHSPTEE